MKLPPITITSILLMSIIMIASGTASATGYYVSTSGDDSNTGLSPNDAWQSPSYAVSRVTAGDTIYLMAGTWYGEHLIFETSGTKDAPITLTTYNGEVILDGVDRFDREGDHYTAIEIHDYYNGLEYININNLIIHDYYRGIYVRNANNVNIDNIEVYDTSYIGVDFVDSHQSSLTNSDIHDNGWNSVSVVAYQQSTSDIQILNNKIHDNPGTSGGPGHNLIDLFNLGEDASLKSIDIKNNYIYNSGLTGSAIFEHGSYNPMYNMNVINNVVYNTKQITLDRFANSVVADNKLYDQAGYGFTCFYEPMSDVTLSGNILSNIAWSELRLTGAPDGKELLITDNDISYYRIDEGTATIRDPQKSTFKIQSRSGSHINVEFSNNQVFKTNGINNPTFGPSSSSYDALGDDYVTFTTYPMTAKPSSSNINIQVNKFDTSLSPGENLVEFVSSSKYGNRVDFTIAELKPDLKYTVKMDGLDFAEVMANEDGVISFSNNIWSEHTFTLTETSASSSSSSGSTPIISSAGPSYSPASNYFTADIGDSTKLAVDAGQKFTKTLWYLDGELMESDSVTYSPEWKKTGVHVVVFKGTAGDNLYMKWTITVEQTEVEDNPTTETPSTPGSSSDSTPIVSTKGPSYSPASGYLTANVGDSTKLTANSDLKFTKALWYVNGKLMEKDSVTYTKEWEKSGKYVIEFKGTAGDNLYMKWTITVSEPEKEEESTIDIPSNPGSSVTGPSYSPASSYLTANVGDSTKLTANSDLKFTKALWYVNGKLMEKDSVTYTKEWEKSGKYVIEFKGTAGDNLYMKWTITVSEPEKEEESTIDTPSNPGSSITGPSYSPASSYLTANVGDSTKLTANSDLKFTKALWYVNGKLMEKDSVTYTKEWEKSGKYVIEFKGTALDNLYMKWTITVSA